MKKYFKHQLSDIYVLSHKHGGLLISPTQINWFNVCSIGLMKKDREYTECTREECESAYKQTIQFLNDKIK
jgi:hypothetical protein